MIIRRGYNFKESLTFYIILVNLAFFVVQIFFPLFTDILSLTPSLALSGHYYQFVSYMFLHGGIMHIVLNMFVLAIFGFPLEQTLGRNRFLIVYMISGIGSAIFYILMMMLMMGEMGIGLLGASGAVFGVLAAYAFKYPRQWVYIFGLIPLPAAVLIIFLLIEETFLGVLSLQPGIANFGHVGGIITGLLIMSYWRLKEERKRIPKGFQFVWE
ncbi:MAG: rhomboid family intramembrane serine protease [Candidatus Aenigmarchaeota archaeon]|nr:rhomboid family intramembrane serine protease [Candidatus Aenigmarchaeota archaeon]NIP40704.1 rhomboid family intramembrane serine protease [Candidatus Aenigmarchaeota archaeon]NIQ18510.1 rhomboid family intramembrane serine protease [Candidatus Aenigmarchaeota archaeon]NIS73409.1 rhomboid family intramembrane serine protease [Candidatus Aenigmarchaeota archaeon]